MQQLIWSLFLETGDIETYLLLKSIEDENEEGQVSREQLEHMK